MGWGGFLDKLIDKLPIQGRKERWKNQLDGLQKERKKLLKGKWDAKKARRLFDIDDRISKLVQLLKNA